MENKITKSELENLTLVELKALLKVCSGDSHRNVQIRIMNIVEKSKFTPAQIAENRQNWRDIQNSNETWNEFFEGKGFKQIQYITQT